MHELAVTQSIIDIVGRYASEAKACRVLRIHLTIGELSSIVDDSIQFYFDFLSQGGIAEKAELCFERIPITLRCEACAHEWQPDSANWVCPECGEMRARAIAGREFYVDSIEVE